MFRVVFAMTVLYMVIAFLSLFTIHIFGAGTSFFSSSLVIWIVIYFIIAYLKFHALGVADSLKLNVGFIAFGITGFCGLIILTNIVELKTGLLSGALQIWNTSYNPFLIVFVMGLLNLIRKVTFENKIINYISKLSLFVYIIHENHLLRTLYRPAIWNYIHETYGYAYILDWVFVITIIIFVFGVVSSIMYFETVHRIVVILCDRVYPRLASSWRTFESKALKIN